MREYRGLITNSSWTESADGELKPFIELIVLTSEPIYSVDDGGQIVARRAIKQTRFGAGLGALRVMRDALNSTIDECEKATAKRGLPEEQL